MLRFALSSLRIIRVCVLALILALLPASAFALDAKLTEITGLPGASLVAVNPVTNRVYVCGSNGMASTTLWVIDGNTNSILSTVPINAPGALAVNPVTNRIYLTHPGAGTVSIVDGATHAVKSLPVGGKPTTLAVNTVTNTIYVGDFTVAGTVPACRLVVIDGATLRTTATPIPQPRFLVVNSATNQVLVGAPADPNDLVTPPELVGVLDGAAQVLNPFINVGQFVDLALNPAINNIHLKGALATLTFLNPVTGQMIGSPYGGGIGGLAVNAATNKDYVSSGNGKVFVVDGTSGSASEAIVGTGAVGTPVVNAVTNKIYAPLADSVAVIDGTANVLVQTLVLDAGNTAPLTLGVNPVTGRVYVAHRAANKVSVIEGQTNTMSTLPDPATPSGVAVDSVTNRVFVSDTVGLKVIDGTTEAISPLPLGLPLDSLVANPADGKVYGLKVADNSVTIVGAASKVSSAPVAFAFQARSIVAAGNSGAYVLGIAGGQGAFQFISPTGVKGPEIHDGGVALSLAVDRVTNLAYVLTDMNFGVFDPATGVFTPLAPNPSGVNFAPAPFQLVAVDFALRRVFFSDYANAKLQVWDIAGQAFLSPVAVGNQPIGVAVDQRTHQVYVASAGAPSITVIDGQSLTAISVPVTSQAASVITDDARNRAYFASVDGSVAVFAGGKLVETIPNFSFSPNIAGLAVNPVTGKAYSFNHMSKRVSVLTPVAPAQTGLATYIAPLPGDTSFSGTFTADLTAASLYGPEQVPVRRIYYQLDSQTGPWTLAAGDGEEAKATLQNVPLGAHTLYAFATAGEESAPGCPVIGQIAAYSFIRRPGTFQFANPAVAVVDDQRSVAVTVTRNFNDPATVDFTTVPVTAQPGSNFTETQGTLVFQKDETSKTITVPILNQDLGPPALTFLVALSNAGGGNLVGQPNQAVVTVIDDHSRDLQLSQTSSVAPQDATMAGGQITVTLDRPQGLWRLFGELSWRPSGASATGLTAGNYVVQFQPLAGYVTPAQASVVLDDLQQEAITASYVVDPVPPTGGLTVTLAPPMGGWRIKDSGMPGYLNSSDRVGNLPAGTYLVEFRAVAGYATPPPQAVMLSTGETLAGATYVLDDPTTGAAPVLVPETQVRTAAPYQFIGQIQTDQSIGTGFVPLDRVVATAAHLLFDDGSLGYSTGVRWLHQRSAGSFESPPQIPRGAYLFDGYATQRTTDATPGVSTAAARQHDVAVMYFLESAAGGGSGGWLGSDFASNPWLTGARQKLLAGYPAEGVAPASLGHLFATSPALTSSFVFVSGALFQSSAFAAFPGMSGGPLCVRFEDGQLYPAAIYLGGTPGVTTVRAIDHDVVDMFRRAETSGSGGANNVGGGISLVGSGLTGSTSLALGSVQVFMGTPGALAAGARWKLVNQATLRRSGQFAQGLTPGNYTVQFTNVAGYTTPANRAVALAAGNEKVVVANYVPSAPPSITSARAALAIRGQPFRYQLAATFDPTGYRSFQLPAGLTLNATTGLLSGVPTASAAEPLELILLADNAAGTGFLPLSLTIAEPGLLTVTKAGRGTVPAKFVKPTVQAVGSLLSIKATPLAGSLFESWRDAETGEVLSTLPTYTFTMAARTNLQANFILNPFVAAKGTYFGLLQGGTYDLSGSGKVTLTATGSFTASFNIGGSAGTVKNLFDAHGHYEGGFTLANNRLFSLALDLTTGGMLTGTVTDLVNAGQVPLAALRPGKPVKGLAGTYTAVFPVATPDPMLPGGPGFGRITVGATGAIKFTGALGDGTTAMFAGQLNSAGVWPFFLPPGKVSQTVLGILTPNAAAPFSFAGSLQWFRAPNPNDALYPSGFAIPSLMVESSRFTAPGLVPAVKTQPSLDVNLTFTGGNLGLPYTYSATITRAGKGTPGPFTLTQATGLFSGKFLDPTETPAVERPMRGVVIQSSGTGQGLFTMPDGSTGAVLLQKQ